MACCCILAGTNACKNCNNYKNYFGDSNINTYLEPMDYELHRTMKSPKKPILQCYCPYCESIVEKYDKYCHNCGEKLDWSDYEEK